MTASEIERVAQPPEGRSRAKGVADRLRSLLAENPSLPIAIIAMAIFVFLAGDEGGFRGTTFLPVTLLLLALLAVGFLALPRPSPRPAAAVGVGLLAGYAAWSYLSIVWADQQGMAWDGANRTAMYAIVFALFALWPVKGRVAAGLLGTYALGVTGLGLVELLRATASTDPIAFFYEGRLSEPTGYANANVALWFTAFWPALVFAGRREVHPVLRGLFLGSANLLAALAILGQSRSWMAALPLMALLLVAVVPGRARTIVALALVGAGVAAMFDPLSAAYEGYNGRTPPTDYVSDGTNATLWVSAALVLVGALWGLLDRGVRTSATTARRTSLAVLVAFALACAGGVVAFTVVEGNPVTVASDIWDDFKQGEGEPHFDGSRFGLSAGSYRYDYFEVAWNNFTDHPLAGVGSDNYGRQYLREGSTPETPSYPHNLLLRVLSMTGLIGTLLFGGALLGGLIAAFAAIRRAPGLGGVAAGAGVLMFAYFFLHGLLDWIWEFPALGCASFAALGIAAAVDAPTRASEWRLPGGPAIPVAAAVLGVALAVGLTLPWLAERDLRNARELAASNPAAALDRLDRSARLNPLSPVPYTTAAVIEADQGRFGEAKAYIRKALDREPGDPFAYLKLAAIASAEDRRADALRLVARARELSPLDRVAKQVQRRLRKGRFVSPDRLNRMILRDVDSRIGPR